MTFCNDFEKCQTCEVRELCQAFENLIAIAVNYKPKPKSDIEVKRLTEDYLSHMAFTLDEKNAAELYKSIDFEAFQGLIAASMQTIAELYISWDAKCEEIDKLKVQLEAQEAIHNG